MTHEYFAPRLQFYGPSGRATRQDPVDRFPAAVHAEMDREVRRELVREPRATTTERRYDDRDQEDIRRSRERDDVFVPAPATRDDDEIAVDDDVLDVSDDVLDVSDDVLDVSDDVLDVSNDVLVVE